MRQPPIVRTAHIVSTGDELLRGTIVDTNAAFLAGRLREHGVRLQRITVVGDDLDAIAKALEQAASEADFVLVGGGLGPTTDDLTAAAAALAFGKPLRRFAEAEAMVRSAFTRYARSLPECNLKQADLPEGAMIVPNERGSAPGFAMATSRGWAVFFPGVPLELEAMWPAVARAYLPERGSLPRQTLSCFGLGESAIQERLVALTDAYPQVRVSYRATFSETFVGFECDDAGLLREVASRARSAIGPAVFDDQGRRLCVALAEQLRERGLTCAVAESCTGGLVAAELTAQPGASAWFLGGVVAYANEVKVNVLSVPAGELERVGAVSEEVARAMAEGARCVLGADLGLSTTGIAGPTGGTAEKPTGLVHVAVALPGRTVHRVHVFKGYDRSRVQRAAANAVMRLALDECREKP